ncbi:MAG: hypothetical protein RR248_03980 [Clostridia bacterium]
MAIIEGMKALKYLYWNMLWAFGKKNFDILPKNQLLSYQEIIDGLSVFAQEQSFGANTINLYFVEFALNSLKFNDCNKLIKFLSNHFEEMKAKFELAKANLVGKTFQLINGVTRLETICNFLVKNTCCALSDAEYAKIKSFCVTAFGLSLKEIRSFDAVYDVEKIKLYCEIVKLCLSGSSKAEELTCKLFNVDNKLAFTQFKPSEDKYCVIEKGDIKAKIDTLGASYLTYCQRDMSYPFESSHCNGVQLRIYEGKCISGLYNEYKFSDILCMFRQTTLGIENTLKISYINNGEIRRYKLKNLYSKSRKLDLEVSLFPYAEDNVGILMSECINVGGSTCVEINAEGKKYYCALTVFVGGKKINCKENYESNKYCCSLTLSNTQLVKKLSTLDVVIVTTYANSLEKLDIDKANSVGYLTDNNMFADIADTKEYDYPQKQICGILGQNTLTLRAKPIEKVAYLPLFSYIDCMRFGEYATYLIDKFGRNSSLNVGYLTKQDGEKIYLYYGNNVVCLTDCNYSLSQEGATYYFCDKSIQARLLIKFEKVKSYKVEVKRLKEDLKVYVLLALNFAKVALFEKVEGKFVGKNCLNVNSSSQCLGYSTNNLAFDILSYTLRLDNMLQASKNLFVAFKCDQICQIDLEIPCEKIEIAPIFSSNIVAERLNYLAQKNMYALKDKLHAPTALATASCVFISQEFVKNYLFDCASNGYLLSNTLTYCDSTGRLRLFQDKWLLTLGVMYYTTYYNDYSLLDNKQINEHCLSRLQSCNVSWFELPYQLLALKKAVKIFKDNLSLMCKYTTLVSSLDAKQREICELIGAVEPSICSQSYFKSLYTKHLTRIDKCWYYVSLLENLYGIKVANDSLQVKCNATQELDQVLVELSNSSFAIKYDLSSRGTKLNGVNINSSFDYKSVKQENSQIVVGLS